MRISDWSSDVCSSDLSVLRVRSPGLEAGLVKPTQPTAAAGRLAENARMNEDKGARPRAIAAQVLDAVLHRGRSLKAELAQALPALADVRERALVEAIFFAALRPRSQRRGVGTGGISKGRSRWW